MSGRCHACQGVGENLILLAKEKRAEHGRSSPMRTDFEATPGYVRAYLPPNPPRV
ncbi:hypothetical protein Mal65_29300 [Crateriforma conspicua]|nr:hypothetical protein Mal65_29300 [Crateriforma conspicua]